MSHRHHLAVAALAVILSSGCASTPQSDFYTLRSMPPAAQPSPSGLSVAIGPVLVPAQVDRPEIVVTTGPNQVRLEAFHRWASPLQDEISRAVAENLVALLGTGDVTLSDRTLNYTADYSVGIEVQGFESVLGEAAMLDAFWTVRRRVDAGADRSRAGRTTVREPVLEPTHEALAAAHSRALKRLSRDIEAAIRALG